MTRVRVALGHVAEAHVRRAEQGVPVPEVGPDIGLIDRELATGVPALFPHQWL